MGIVRILALAAAWGAGGQEAGRVETVRIPGTDFSIEMVSLPGGRFRMGSPEGEPGRRPDEGPVREMELRPFWISRYEVSWEIFARWFESHPEAASDGVTRPSKPYEAPNAGMGTGRHPAISMKWHGAVQCTEWISRKTGQRFRLPTEAEWEYACRAGSDRPAPEPLGDYAWYAENSGDRTHEVGTRKPNAFGLYDLLGNVWEYTLEPYRPPAFGPVLRGGAWNSPAADCRAARRQTVQEEWYERDPNRPRSIWWFTDAPFVGFRVVRFADPRERADQEAYAAKIEVIGLKAEPVADAMARVTGEIRNGGDRTLEEVELTVFYLDEQGKPLFADRKDRATFTKAYPVLVNSAHPGEHRQPLAPGASRRFQVEIPQAYDYDVDLDRVGARVTALQFAPGGK